MSCADEESLFTFIEATQQPELRKQYTVCMREATLGRQLA